MIDNITLVNLLDKIKGKKILLAGDLMLDRYIMGTADRISDEAPVPIVRVKGSEDRLGGAGNTAANLAGIGAEVYFAGVVGNDFEGRRAKDILNTFKVNTAGVFNDRGRPTILKTRVVARNQQVVRIDWEDTRSISGEIENDFIEYFKSMSSKVDCIIVSDYAKGTLTKKFFDYVTENKANYGRQCPIVIDPNPANYNLYNGFTLAKPNRKEAETASGIKITSIDEAKAAAGILSKKWDTEIILLSLGEDGLLIHTPEKDFVIPTRARKVFDVSGAGDTVTAVFSAAFATGASIEDCAELANFAAGIVVAEVGTVAITREKILGEITDNRITH